MDNFNTSENCPAQEIPEDEKFTKPRGQAQRPYGDLRELLNQKRQQTNEGKRNTGPPPDPKHNFLADPLRDNEQDSNNVETADNSDSARFSTTYNQPHFQTRVSRGGRGRFGSSNRGDQRSQYNNNYGNRRDDEWRDERSKVDQERINRQKTDDGGWAREWDVGKEEVPASVHRGRFNTQYRDQNYAQHRKYDNSSRSDKRGSDTPRSDNRQRSDNYPKSDNNFRSTHQSRSGRPSSFDNQPKFENNNQEDNNPDQRSPGKYNQSRSQNPRFDLESEDINNAPRSNQNVDPHHAPRSPGKYLDRSNQNYRSDQQQYRSSRKHLDRSNQNPDMDQQDSRSSRKYLDRSNQKSDIDQQDSNTTPRSTRKYQGKTNQNLDLHQDPNITPRSARKFEGRSNQKPGSEPELQQDQNPTPRSPTKYQGRSNHNPGTNPNQQEDPNTTPRSPRSNQTSVVEQQNDNARPHRKYYSGRTNPNFRSDQDPNSSTRPQQYNPDRFRGSNQNRPPHRFNPNYRGSKSYSKRRNATPINITVEYYVDTGERKCSYDTVKKENEKKDVEKVEENVKIVEDNVKKVEENVKTVPKVQDADNWASVPLVQAEENWDDYDYNEEYGTNLQSPKETQELHDFEEYEPDLDEDFERVIEKVNTDSNEVDLMSEMKKAEELHDYEEDLEDEVKEETSKLDDKKDDLMQIGELKQCVSKLKEILGNEPGIDMNPEIEQMKKLVSSLKSNDSQEELKTTGDDKELKNSKQIGEQDSKQSKDLKKIAKEDDKKKDAREDKSKTTKQSVVGKKIAKQEDKKDVKMSKEQSKNNNSKQDGNKIANPDSKKDSMLEEVKSKNSQNDEIKTAYEDLVNSEEHEELQLDNSLKDDELKMPKEN